MHEQSLPTQEQNQYRYPGTQPFDKHQMDVFYGREKDIESLIDFIGTNQVVVLYSKSGLGKSSLLKAGLIPTIETAGTYKPVLVRFKSHDPQSGDTPLFITRKNVVKGKFERTWLDQVIFNEPSLWHDIKEQQIIAENKQPILLIFDQFEELFDYPDVDIDDLKFGLAEILFTLIPQRYRDIIEENNSVLTKEQFTQLHHPLGVKIVFSIRADRLHQLNELNDAIPNILKNCYELQPLSKEGAEDAIFNPALKKSDRFQSPNFTYEAKAANEIIAFLSQNGRPIESFELQVICNAVEREVIEKGLSKISVQDLGDLGNKIENYYNDQLNTFKDEAERENVRSFLENGLISDTSERRRSLKIETIKEKFGLDASVIARLVDTHLVRAERLPDDSFAYELSHDSLVKPILKAKTSREQQAREAKLEQETREAKEKEKATRRQLQVYFVLGAIAVMAAVFAFRSYREAENNLALAQKTIELAIKPLIYNLDYQTFLKDGVYKISPKTTFELAYYYSATNSMPKDTLNQVFGLVAKAFDVSAMDEKCQSAEKLQGAARAAALLDILKNADPALFDTLTRKYYPHMISFGNFELAQTEVTMWQYNIYCKSSMARAIEATAPNWGIKGDFPVVKVDWYDAVEYANWLSEQHGFNPVYTIKKQNSTDKRLWQVSVDVTQNGYRLPDSREWRYAAAYKQNPDWQYAGSADSLEVAWFPENSLTPGGIYEPHPVAQLKPNLSGLYDMSGNVMEWCNDDPTDKTCCQDDYGCKMVIGGSFIEGYLLSEDNCGYQYPRVSVSSGLAEYDDTFSQIGFRLCRTVK